MREPFGRSRPPGLQSIAEAGAKVKSAAQADRAFDPNSALHQFDQSLTDSEAQAGAAKFSRSAGVGLLEGMEDHLGLLRRNSDSGIADTDQKRDLGLADFQGLDPQHDFAVMS